MAGTNSDFDLTQVASEDLDALAQKIEQYYRQDASAKAQLTYAWDRNHKFLDGDQWIVFEGDKESGGQWTKLKVNKANEYIPRPVTNVLMDVYMTLKSYLIKNKPRSTIIPNTTTHNDKTAAKIGNLILECNWERLHEQQNYEYAAACLVTYGTVFKKSYWDPSSLQMAKVPVMQQVQTPAGMEEVQVKDPMTGELQFQEIPLGDVDTVVVEPHRMALDPLGTDMHKMRWIMEYSIQGLTLVQETYDKQEPGYTGRVMDVKPEKNLSSTMQRYFQLRGSSGVRGGGQGATSGDLMPENAVVLKEYYERPSYKFPKGRMVVVANGITLYSGDSPYEGPEQGDWHPYSECRWEILPGRFWGKSPMDDGVPIQKRINSIDSVVILTRKTMAVPQKLIPTGSGVLPGAWTGRPGQEIPYRPADGYKPETIAPVGVDEQVFQERASSMEDLKGVTGAIDILKGDRPPGVTAASALNMLFEVGTGKLFPTLDRWKKFVETDQKKQLRIINKRYKEPRPDFIRLLKSKNKELAEEEINEFIGEDLYDNCNVSVEAGSNVPKLQAAKQAMLMESLQAGMIDMTIPANRMEAQRQLGLTGFDNDVGPDTKRAEWENSLMDNINLSPDNRPVLLEMEDHAIHKEVHLRRMKEPAFMSLSPEVQTAYSQHLMEHETAMQRTMMMEQQNAMAMGQPPGGPPNPNASKPVQGQGKGAPKEVKNAMMSDATVPGSIGE